MMKRIETLLCNRRKHICYLPNWLNDSLREEIDALPNKHKKRTASPVRLLYAGNIGKKQDLLKFCRFMHRQDFDFEFCIYGAGGEANHVDEWVSSVRDPRFSYGPFLDEAGFAEALNYTDFFVITEKKGIGASFIPSKLIPAIYSGTPILAVCDCDSPLGQEMSAFKLGCQFPWDNLDGLIPNFVKYIKNPRKFLEARQNCVSRSMFFKRDRVIDSFLESLNSNFSIPFP